MDANKGRQSVQLPAMSYASDVFMYGVAVWQSVHYARFEPYYNSMEHCLLSQRNGDLSSFAFPQIKVVTGDNGLV